MGKAFTLVLTGTVSQSLSGELRTSQVLILSINTRQAGISVRESGVSSFSGQLTTKSNKHGCRLVSDPQNNVDSTHHDRKCLV